MLELALHLESKVFRLKQNALRLMKIVLAGTACGQILTLFEFAFGYPESKESKEHGKQLEELEHYFDINNKLPGEEDKMKRMLLTNLQMLTLSQNLRNGALVNVRMM